MTLLPGEELLATLNNDRSVLTNQRIQTIERSWGSLKSTSMFLENISSISVCYVRSYLTLLITGIVFFPGVVMVVQSPEQPKYSGSLFFVAVMMLLVWTFTRRKVIQVTSSGSGKMHIDVNNLSRDEIETLIDDIQLAQANRLRAQQGK